MRLREYVVALAVATLAIIGISPAAQATQGETQPGNDGIHKVWVCKYSGTPYVDEVLKPGKNPIAVDASATVGEWFKDGQTSSYVIDDVTNENTAQGETYTGEAECPSGRSFDWNWEYPAPTCTDLVVTYPENLPVGQANDMNVTFKNLVTQATTTLNFHHNGGTWSGTKTFDFTAHSSWPDWGYYAVTWVQVGGTNYHWQGSITCGERVKPEKPAPQVDRGQWEVSDYACGTETVEKTRTITTTDWVWDESAWEWVLDQQSSTTTEKTSRDMTEAEKAEHCAPPVVDVCSNLEGVQTEVPAGYKTHQDGTCSPCEPPRIDVCKNLDGMQTTVPEGYEVDEDGNCTIPPVDVCTNLPGLQTQVPEGLTAGDEGTCTMPATVEVSDWEGEPACGVTTFTQFALKTTTTYQLDLTGGIVAWLVDKIDVETLYRTVVLEGVIPCEDASASITVTPATCAAPGSIDTVTTEFATAAETPATEPGDHSVTFIADEGHAFPGGATELTVEYTIEEQATEGCTYDEPQEPSIDGSILGEVCTADAPYLGYDIVVDDPDGQYDGDGTATLTFVHPTDPSQNWTRTVAIGSGKILWPGASVDEDGVADGWPGWEYSTATESWEPVGDANYGWTREPDVEVILTVNPSTSFTVTYPPATPECNSEPPTDIVVVLDAPPATAVAGVVTYTG
ncbi:hypothetical protein [Demequina subtropica]|uniref:hypothetical protein n=1 Tax=Demequina subtropica TaxID=1638989 RepID=UPI000B2C82F7|nr:hypothetical protein [Demequina subtropica]